MTQAYVELVKAYADHIAPLIPAVVEKMCLGCNSDPPSQQRHDVCLGMRLADRVDFCLGYAVCKVDEDAVMKLYNHRTKRCSIKHEVYSSDKWRRDLWDDRTWREHVCYEVLQRLKWTRSSQRDNRPSVESARSHPTALFRATPLSQEFQSIHKLTTHTNYGWW